MSPHSARLTQSFSNVGHLLTHLLMLLYPTVILTLEREYSMSYGELLALSVPGGVLYGICALPAGWLGDRWSAEYMMIIFYVGSGLAAIGTGLADGATGILVGLTLIGVFGAIYHPVGLAWLVRNAENRGRALGLNGFYGSVGVGSASLVAAMLTAIGGWRSAFIIPGIACIGIGLALWWCVRARSVIAATHDRKPIEEPTRGAIIRAFIVLSVTMLSAGLIWHALTVVMPKLFEQRLTDLTAGSTVAVGALVSLVFVFSAAMQLVGGWAADRFPLKQAYVISWGVQVPLLLALAYASELPLLLTMIFVFCVVVISTPVENTLLARYTPGNWRATAYGAKFVLSLGLGSLAIPIVALVHTKTGDFTWLFGILGGLAALIVAAGLFLPADRERKPPATPIPLPAE